jgi:squalene synthase HpnC
VKNIPDHLAGAFAHCARLTKAHYENFPVASWLLPGHVRPHVCSIYAFARTADDFADEPGMTQAERLEKLDEWQHHLDTCADVPADPIFVALAHTIRTFDIPVSLFNDLLSAFRQDVNQSRHQTFEDLLNYSKRSANPVGRLILTLFGYNDVRMFAESDAICTALQLTNFWQDIEIDYGRGRIYLPKEEMVRHNITEADLGNGEVSDRFKSLVKDMIHRTRQLFLDGKALPDRVTGRLKYELRLTWLGGFRILQKIEEANFDIFRNRPSISKSQGVGMLFRSLRSIETIT